MEGFPIAFIRTFPLKVTESQGMIFQNQNNHGTMVILMHKSDAQMFDAQMVSISWVVFCLVINLCLFFYHGINHHPSLDLFEVTLYGFFHDRSP